MYLLCVFFWGLESLLFAKSAQKWLQKVAKRRPKATQMEDVRPLKTPCFYNRKLTLGRFLWAQGTHFFYTAFWTLFFCDFSRLFRFWVPKGYPKGGRVSWGNVSKFDPFAKKLPRDPKGGPGVAKWCQNAPKECQNEGPGTLKLRF